MGLQRNRQIKWAVSPSTVLCCPRLLCSLHNIPSYRILAGFSCLEFFYFHHSKTSQNLYVPSMVVFGNAKMPFCCLKFPSKVFYPPSIYCGIYICSLSDTYMVSSGPSARWGNIFWEYVLMVSLSMRNKTPIFITNPNLYLLPSFPTFSLPFSHSSSILPISFSSDIRIWE